MSDFRIVKLLDRLNPTIITGGFVPRGAYDNATDYAVGDSVDYNGSSYVMFNNASAGTLPTDTDYWQVVANGNGGVYSVNTKNGIVVLDPDDLDDTSTTNKFTTAGDISKLAGIEALADVTDTTNVTSAGAVMDSELTSLSGVKTLTVPDNTTISTFGATITDDTDAAAARTTLGLTAGGAGDIWVEKAGDTMTGNLVFSGSQKIIGGTSTTADLTLQTTTGVGATGADMHFLVGNNGATEAMTILNDGKVGVNTNAPTYRFTVEETNTEPVIAFHRNQGVADGNDIGRLVFRNLGTDTARIAAESEGAAEDAAHIVFDTATGGTLSEKMRIESGGNVGIGNTSPTAKLMIDGSADDQQLIVQAHSTQTANILEIQNSSATPLVVVSGAGNVGIGTTAPAGKLEVLGASAAIFTRTVAGASAPDSAIQIGLSETTATVGGGPSFLLFGNNSAGTKSFTGRISSVWENVTAGSEAAGITFSTRANTGDTTASTERMRITSGGNVGIGTTNPTAKLQVNGSGITLRSIGENDTSAVFQQFNTSANSGLGYFGVEGNTPGATLTGTLAYATFLSAGSSGSALQLGTAGGIRMTINSAGNVGIGTTTPAQKLQVTANVGDNAFARFAGNAGTTYWDIGRESGVGDFRIGDETGEKFRITKSAGNVGIGNTSPTAKLMIDGSADDQQLIVQAHSTQTTNILEIQNSSAAALMSVSGTGKLGIGTAATYILDVLAPAADTYATYITQGKQLMLLGIENSTAASVSNTVGFEFRLKSTTQTRSAFRFDGGFTTTTDASRTSYVGISTSNSGAFAENFRLEGTKATLTGEIQIGGNLNHDGTNIGFFGVTPTTRQTELTDELTTVTFTAPGTPDYAIQALVNVSGYGFATQDEGHTLLSVVANLQTRVNELETKLVAYGLLIDAD